MKIQYSFSDTFEVSPAFSSLKTLKFGSTGDFFDAWFVSDSEHIEAE